ncbi:hypothetical protein [Mesonia sp. HuA40]|nr:hypothetical protein [Mesonia sp. HuA40]
MSQLGVNNVVDYIKNQENHHRKKSFREEYIDSLNAYEIDFNSEYIFADD